MNEKLYTWRLHSVVFNVRNYANGDPDNYALLPKDKLFVIVSK